MYISFHGFERSPLVPSVGGRECEEGNNREKSKRRDGASFWTRIPHLVWTSFCNLCHFEEWEDEGGGGVF